MRVLFTVVIVILLLILVGWLAVNFDGNSATVELRTDKIKEDTSQVLDETRDLINRADDKINEPTPQP